MRFLGLILRLEPRSWLLNLSLGRYSLVIDCYVWNWRIGDVWYLSVGHLPIIDSIELLQHLVTLLIE